MPPTRTSSRPPIEELIIYTLLIITGVIPVSSAVKAGGDFGVEATIGGLMTLIGIAGLAMYAWHSLQRGKQAAAAHSADGAAGSRSR